MSLNKGLSQDPRVCVCVCVSSSVVYNSLQPHGLQPNRLLCPWNSSSKNNGVGSHSKPFPHITTKLGKRSFRTEI